MDIQMLITLGIILLISAGIFYYFYSRLNVLEESVINQGKILQSFLLNQQAMPPVPLGGTNTDNTYTKIDNDKIDVSDDGEESESESESEYESECESECKEENDNDNDDNDNDDNDSDDNDNKVLKVDNTDLSTTIGVVDIKDQIDSNSFIFTQILDVSNVPENLNLEKNQINNLDNTNNLDDLSKIKLVEFDNKNINIEEIEPSESGETDETKKRNKSIHKMNNQELKELILKKGLATNDDITKLKKSELIELLQNKDK